MRSRLRLKCEYRVEQSRLLRFNIIFIFLFHVARDFRESHSDLHVFIIISSSILISHTPPPLRMYTARHPVCHMYIFITPISGRVHSHTYLYYYYHFHMCCKRDWNIPSTDYVYYYYCGCDLILHSGTSNCSKTTNPLARLDWLCREMVTITRFT